MSEQQHPSQALSLSAAYQNVQRAYSVSSSDKSASQPSSKKPSISVSVKSISSEDSKKSASLEKGAKPKATSEQEQQAKLSFRMAAASYMSMR